MKYSCCDYQNGTAAKHFTPGSYNAQVHLPGKLAMIGGPAANDSFDFLGREPAKTTVGHGDAISSQSIGGVVETVGPASDNLLIVENALLILLLLDRFLFL